MSLSPVHLTTLLLLTYILNRPSIYCSFLLVILFASSCHWSGKCLWEATSVCSPNNASSCGGVMAGNASESLTSRWATYALPRLYANQHTCRNAQTTSDGAMAAFLGEVANSTICGLATAAKESAGALVDSVKQKVVGEVREQTLSAPTHGIGTQWLKSLLGRSEWTLPCIGVKVVL
ncbi:hypothetical protein DV737_g3963, partial [Chaetothyriales sp. CBS 132003]